MAKINLTGMKHLSGQKKAPFYKLWWCALRHVKKYKIYPVWNGFTQQEEDIKVYGCMKCNIWRREQ